MNNDIVQLTDKNGNNVFPIAGAATQDSISKSMLEEGVFEGPELFPAPSGAYVRTENIVDGAVTSDKIDSATLYIESPVYTISSIGAQEAKIISLNQLFSNYSQIVSDYTIVGIMPVITGPGSGGSLTKIQGVGSSLTQANYGVSVFNSGSSTFGGWTLKVILTVLKKQSS